MTNQVSEVSFSFLGKSWKFTSSPGGQGNWYLRGTSDEGWYLVQIVQNTYGWTAYLFCEGGHLASVNKFTEQEALSSLESLLKSVDVIRILVAKGDEGKAICPDKVDRNLEDHQNANPIENKPGLSFEEHYKLLDLACLASWVHWGMGWWNLDSETKITIIIGYACEYLTGSVRTEYLTKEDQGSEELQGFNPGQINGYDLYKIYEYLKRDSFDFVWHAQRADRFCRDRGYALWPEPERKPQ